MRAFSALLLFSLLAVAGCRRDDGDGPFPVEDVAFDVPEGVTPYVPTLDGPLRVLSATPAGQMLYLREGVGPTVTFTRPMVPLGDAPAPPEDAITLDPPVPGSLRWEGTQTLVFTPDAPLTSATAYRATLRATGLQSVEGETLARDTTWIFETPRPRLVTSDPADGEQYAAPSGPFTLTFNQRVRADRVDDYLALRAEGSSGALRLTSVQQKGDSSVVVKPTGLVPGTPYTLTLRAGLPSADGPLGMLESRVVSFRVRPRLAFLNVSQETYGRPTSTLDPARGITLTFSTPVRFGDLRKALRITPSVEFPAGIEARDDATSTDHTLALGWKPETTYEITVEKLTDIFGQTLARETKTFRTGPLAPAFRMPEGLMIVEARREAALPVRLTNTSEMRVRAERLSAGEVVPALLRYDTQHWYGQDERADPPAPTRTVALDVPRNTPVRRLFRVDSLLQRNTGIVAFNVRDALKNRDRVRDRSGVVQFTDLGLTAKFSPHQNLLFVTRLATAAPVAGATVTLRDANNRVRWTGTTDEKGRAVSPGWGALGIESPNEWSAPVQFFFAEKDGDLAFTSSVYTDGIEPYRFSVDYNWNPRPQTVAGSIFTDRGLYRAGEEVHVKGILRVRKDEDWQVLRDSVRVLAYDARDAIVYDRALRPSEMGAFDFSLQLASSAAQGPYEVRVVRTDDTTATTDRYRWGSTLASGYFRVDAFRTASFAVDATLAAPSYVAGDRVDARVEGRYLFGAAMGGQPVTYALQQQPGSYAPPGYEGWRFGTFRYDSDAYGRSAYQTLARSETNLDADGVVTFSAVAEGSERGTGLDLALSATVTDPARQQLSDRRVVTLHPGLFYVGLKPRTTYLDLSRDKEMPLDVLTVDPNGSPVAATVEVTLVKENWISAREVGVDGRLQWRSERVETPVGTQTVTTQRGKAKRLTLPVKEGGQYLVRATGQDVRGNVIRSEAYFYAAGGGYTAWERQDDDRIDLISDKTSYAPGETARILIQSPYEEATALVTVEREGVMESRVETLRGTSPQVEIKLTEAHLPNVFVSVMLLTGRVAEPSATADVGAPAFKIGYVNLPVDATARHLRVEVEPGEKEYRPGEEVEVELRLVDERGRGVAGEITFSAADAGVLNLINYTLPDPYQTFYGPRALGVTTAEARANLIELRAFGQKEEDMGGGGGDDGERLRKDFRPLAYWNPALRTDRSGKATVRFRVPERLTTFRLMATAATADHRFGAGQQDLVVTQPLVLSPALPRFVRPGDAFEAGVLVTNRTDADGDVEVTVTATGLSLRGNTTQTVRVARGATREVRFPFATPTTGTPRLQFKGALGRERDALQIDVPLQVPTTKEVTATFAATDSNGKAAEALRLPADRIAGLGFFEARLSSTALVGLDGATRYLFTYPYGCLEQRTSAIRPLLLGKNLLDAYDLTVLDGTADAQVKTWLASLDDFWTGAGFTMWKGENSARYVNPYTSAYVVLALAEAKAAGYTPPAALTQSAVDWLDGYVRQRASKPDYYPVAVWNDARALMLYALARHGRRVEGEIQALVNAPTGTLSTEGEAVLLRAIVASKSPALAQYRETLAQRVLGRLRVESTQAYLERETGDDWGWIFASDARATAYGLAALAETRATPETRLIAQRMVAYLMASREGGAWASTQDNAVVVDAFNAFAQAFEKEAPDLTAQVRVAGRQVVNGTFQGRTLKVEEAQVPLKDLPSGETPIDVTATGRGRAYYSLRATTYRSTPLPALSQGLTVERRVEVLDAQGKPQPAQRNGDGNVEVEAGALVRVTLRLVSPTDRSYVVVDDALPAGLEALNAAFATVDQEALQNAGAGQNQWWGSFNHTELQDDRVLLFADYLRAGEHTYVYLARATTPGVFVHPAVEAEMMYRPEIRGAPQRQRSWCACRDSVAHSRRPAGFLLSMTGERGGDRACPGASNQAARTGAASWL